MDTALWLPYTQMKTASVPYQVRTTQGCELVLENGQTLIDGIASWWTACHGYHPPEILQAITEQSYQLSHVMLGGLVHESATLLAHRLSALLPDPLNHVFFSESGSVAVEVALKMAIQFWLNQNKPQRNRFIHFTHAYHGDTFLAMSVCCPQEGMHHLFQSQLPKQVLQAIPQTSEQWASLERFLIKEQESIAGLIIEPLIQGAGGMKCHSPETLNQLVTLVQKYDIPVIFDEIFTGFGRTGTMFALDQIEAVPDIVTLGKALTGGVTPLAATIASSEIFEQFWSDSPNKALMHGPTFMGHAIGCRAALASLDIFKTQPRLAQVKTIESQLSEGLLGLSKHPKINAVRIKGAMGVVELKAPLSAPILQALKDFYVNQNVWIRPFGRIIYLTPAFVITKSQLNTLIEKICESLRLL